MKTKKSLIFAVLGGVGILVVLVFSAFFLSVSVIEAAQAIGIK